MKKIITTGRKGQKLLCKKYHRRCNLRQTVYCKNAKPKPLNQNIYRGFQCHVTHGKFRRKYDKPQGRKKRVAVGYSRTLTGGNRSNWHIYQRHEVKLHRVKLSNT